MDTDSFIINTKIEDFYEDNANDVEKRFDTSNYEVNRPLPKGKNNIIIINNINIIINNNNICCS